MATWDEIKAGIFAGESGGDYNALFGFSNRPGGRWAGTNITDMTVDEAIQFTNPSGPYAQWVKDQIGRVATPIGGFQVVGSTLRKIKDSMGLTGSERMTPEMQDRIGQQILKEQGTGAWMGYKGPRDPSSVKGVTINSTPFSSPWSAAAAMPEEMAGDAPVSVADAPVTEQAPATWQEAVTKDLEGKDDETGGLEDMISGLSGGGKDNNFYPDSPEIRASISNWTGVDPQVFQSAQAMLQGIIQNRRKPYGTTLTG